MRSISIIAISCIFVASCGNQAGGIRNQKEKETMRSDSTLYGYNREFLKKHTGIIELRRGDAAVAIVPEWQGRVMTSTAEGDGGFSFGWINHKLISSGMKMPHINPYGGEERLWLGPEGGQYSIFFLAGKEFIYDNWQTPSFLDTITFATVAVSGQAASFSHTAEIANYSGTVFKIRIDREVILVDAAELPLPGGVELSGVRCVAYRSVNGLTNVGDKEWKKETGLLSIWMLGMFTPSPSVVVVIPFVPGDEQTLGPAVNDNYFGEIPPDRLKISGNLIFFRADGKSRGKIGIPPLRAAGIMGSYDSENNVLTLLTCKLPEGITDYVNSAWMIQKDPYSGDALNSYNDGPLEDGSQMGPFYELETSSPAAALKPGETMTHSQITIHLTGNREALDAISKKVLGITLDGIEKIFPNK